MTSGAIGRVGLLALFGLALGFGAGCGKQKELLNVSYDPTREVFKELNDAFLKDYQARTGEQWSVNVSNGGSGSQARAVIDGLPADVVTLALPGDIAAIARKGLIEEGWEERLPHRSLPWVSTIVFVVRQGNPSGIKDWPDLIRDDLQIITPNPKTSGNGRLSFLAAWGSVLHRGGSEEEAREYVTRLYRHVPVLDAGARGATATFCQKGIGDVHLTWENEAYLELREAGGGLEIVYPESGSIRAEPPVAVVDANVDRKGTRAAATAYLQFLYTPEAQCIIARHKYRPIDEKILAEFSKDLPPLKLFPITTVARSWDNAQEKFFADKGIFDTIYQPRK
jgi:sulfate transport system substrate-binding protein